MNGGPRDDDTLRLPTFSNDNNTQQLERLSLSLPENSRNVKKPSVIKLKLGSVVMCAYILIKKDSLFFARCEIAFHTAEKLFERNAFLRLTIEVQPSAHGCRVSWQPTNMPRRPKERKCCVV